MMILFNPWNPAFLIPLNLPIIMKCIKETDNRNIISSFMTKSKRLVFDSRTSDDESSDNLRPHSSIDKNNAPIPASIHNESSVHNDRATLLDHRKPKCKLYPLR
ncbi:hypothetical protein AVEN_161164-1 [Araneus ventricosus]|uniref:Uncharacterized protein n=1 Tax=Araneus ventricosus TaxID=182803 RepID=A0A4Y2PB80_ARAVE|nr:hypothetical protein AVEN_3905-1 [Araneus ventricosus]GBN48352.1 hypothetical protein AVEN_101356-1 [Araneus ventricosus]GBN48510.1 hypothetical protein AVEN_116560-1 [Araneus ventricosus]GBN48531.1 hypothetical protein AVEN_161164-1 [Araneus ventricosus]